jgi:putative peptidoglycan lipid II flippase
MRVPAAVDAASASVPRNSITVSAWTLVSRLTGFARVAVIAAVLGPTYFGNTFQAINQLPNLIIYGLLMGSLFSSLLVPSLVRQIDARDRDGLERVAGAFLGLVTAAFVAVAALGAVTGPLLLGVFTAGVEDPSVASAQRRIGWLLLLMVLPQVLLYGLACTAAAVMNAHGRFALASAAPALENLGTIATLGASAWLFGTGTAVEQVPLGQLLLLGIGSTAAVAVHAAVQWLGAWRLGIRLVPRAGWRRDPRVRRLIQRLLPSLGYGSLNMLRWFAVLVAANRVPGGVVAFQLALNFYYLPVVLGAQPVALALLPELSRLFQRHDLRRLREELTRGFALASFLTTPAAVAYLILAVPLARMAAFGEMATASGVILLAAGLATLAPGVVGESRFLIALQGAYACHDARSPVRSMALCASLALAGAVAGLALPAGTGVLLVLGLAYSAGSLAGGADLSRRVHRTLPRSSARARPAILRALIASALMAGPAYLAAAAAAGWAQGRLGSAVQLAVASGVGAGLYFALQRLWRSPELGSLLGAVRARARPVVQ